MFHISEEIKNLSESAEVFLAQASGGLFSFIISPNGFAFAVIKAIFIVLTIGLVVAVVYFLATTSYLKLRIWEDVAEVFTYKPYGSKKMTKKWRKILARLEIPDESEYKLAVIEADDLLDDILKRIGYGGQNLKERLSNITAVNLPGIAAVSEAHTIRDSIVHDPNYRLTLDQTRKLLDVYEQAMRGLEAVE